MAALHFSCVLLVALVSIGTAFHSPAGFPSPSDTPRLTDGTHLSARSPFSFSQPTSDHTSLSRRQAWERVAAAATVTTSGLLLPTPQVASASTQSVSTTLQATPALIPTTRLGNSDLVVSRTIQGYWQLAGGHGRYKETDAIANMKRHYDAGFTTLDTADIYGPSEIIMGKFIKTQPQAIPCTKFCCFRFLDEIDRAEVKQRILNSCERLQVNKLPLVNFFWSNYGIKKYVDVGLFLAELKEEGLIGEIGATNFDLQRLQELKNSGVPVVAHQVQMSALDRRAVQSGMATWCAENNVSLTTYGTVGSGILSDRYLGKGAPTQEERNTASMRMYSTTASRFGDWKLLQDLLRTMDAVANEVRSDGRCTQATISNIAQRYVLETPAVASILIGVRNPEHIAENARTHSFTLTQAERDAIDTIVAKRKGPQGDVWDIERGTM